MNKKLCLIALSCALASGWNTLSAQDVMVIHPKAGNTAPKEFVLNDLGKLTFSETGFFVFDKSGKQLGQDEFNKVSRINFKLTSVGIQTMDVPQCFPYPSPASETISLAGWNSDEPADVAIYSMDGRLCLMQHDWNGEPIQVSSLTKGLYILKINNQTFKFSKL